MFHFPYKLCLIALSSFLCFTSSFPARLSFASFSSSHLPCILICSPPVVANHKSLNTFLTEKNTGKPFQNFHHDMQPKGANESSRAPAAQNVFGKLVPCSPGRIELVHHMFLAETLSSSLLSFRALRLFTFHVLLTSSRMFAPRSHVTVPIRAPNYNH